jgi:DNA repair protein RadC
VNYRIALVQLPLVCDGVHERVRSPADAHRACADLAGLAQESFHVLSIDAKNGLINRHMVSLGLADSALIHPREVFRAAIMDDAKAVVLVHNHPSGDPTPSAEDVRLTRQLVEAGKIVGIGVMDHVIIGRPVEPTGDNPGRRGWLSMRESGLCSFE